MSESDPHRRPVRYEAQNAPSQGSRGATVEGSSEAWVGAFERVLGDDPGDTSAAAASASERRPNRRIEAASGGSEQALSRDPSTSAEGSQASNIADVGSGRASPRKPFPSKQRSRSHLRKAWLEEPVQKPGEARGSDRDPQNLDTQHLHPSGHRLAHKGSNRSLRAAGPTPTAKTNIRSYGPDPEDEDDMGQPFPESSLSLARTASGPTLLKVASRSQQDTVLFEDLYLNHAPGLQPVRLRNVLGPGKSVLVRLESDMGHAVSFMRRKRTAPKNELDKLVWPSNTLAWARGVGLSPTKLRELRAISTNLEVADSLILEGGASTEIFVIFRPNLAAPTIRQSQRPFAPPLASRSSSQSSAAASPQLTAAFDAMTVPAPSSSAPRSSSPSPAPDVVATSPRSAPDLLSHGSGHFGTYPFRQTEASGVITIRAWPLPVMPTPSEEGVNSSHSSATSSRPTSMYGSTIGSSGLSLSTAITELSEVEPQLVQLQLVARFCRPQLALTLRQPGSLNADSDGTRTPLPLHRQGLLTVDFGDVVAGQTVETELTLINQSEIECFWQNRIDCGDDPDAQPCLSILGAETSEAHKLASTNEGAQYQPYIIAPRSSLKLKLLLRSERASSDFEELLAFTNLHNTSNSIRVLVRANVLAAGRDPSLAVLSGDSLDFGDCCGGHWARQLLVLKNVASHGLEISLSAQKGYEVTFELAQVAETEEEVEAGEDFSAGASAASSETTPSGSSASNEQGNSAYTSSAASVASESPRIQVDGDVPTSYSSIGTELSRTPTHHASAVGAEPPTFDLGGSSVDVEKTPVTLTPYAHPPAPKHEPDESDDFDSSSVASQAGSRPASPQFPLLTETLGNAESGASGPGGRFYEPKRKDGAQSSVLAWREASRHTEPSGDPDGSSDRRSRPASACFSASSLVWKDNGSSGHRDEEETSVFSEATNLSLESRSAAPSSQGKSLGSAISRAPRSQPSGTALRSVVGSDDKEIESLALAPGEETRIIVAFRPVRGEMDEVFSAGRLHENTFRITLDYAKARINPNAGGLRARGGRERKTVLCRTRTCTSFITVSPTELDFGETNVGSRKTNQIAVSNRSDLSARVDLRFVSKVLSMYRDEIAVPAGQTIHLSVDYSPRRVNLAYSKQITVANLLNRRNDQIIEVRGRNVDKQRISFHSLFYRILTPHGSNFLEFGDVNINSSRVRTFAIENTSNAPLVLDITTAHPEDIALYVKSTPARSIHGTSTDSDYSSLAADSRRAKGYEDAEPTVIAQATVSRALANDGSRAGKAKGAELKERFLETITSDTPANVRQENTSWRTAQKLSHFRRDAASTAALGQSREGQSASQKGKSQLNLASALKKGGKGRVTHIYGHAVAFKDRTLLQSFEFLDLASGPPLVAKRISVKSKCFQMLEQLEAGNRSKTKSESPGASNGQIQSEPRVSTPSSSQNPPRTPDQAHKLPSKLAQDIKSKAGTPSRPIGAPDTASNDRSPALTGKKKVKHTALDPTDVSRLSLDQLLNAWESQPSALSTLFFNSAQAEEKHVRTEVNLQRELKRTIESNQLEPLGLLRIPPGEERQVVAIYCPNGSTRPHIQGTARKQDSRIFLRLVEYDVEVVRTSSEFHQMADFDRDELPIRDLMVRTTTCRAMLELGQPHINFGQMEKGETKTRKILIHNRSEWTARYCISKSGSIASGDIKLSSGRYGVVPAYGKREVEFIFSPSLTGPFQEKLVIENVADRDRDLTVFLKATVRKKPNFAVDPAFLDFGSCKSGKLSKAQSFNISNTTDKPRTFVVAVDTGDLMHQRTITDLIFSSSNDGDGRATLSKAEETSIAEEIEHISQKLKIATRKGQKDKIKKYENRLAALDVRTQPGSNASSDQETSAQTSKDAASRAEASDAGGSGTDGSGRASQSDPARGTTPQSRDDRSFSSRLRRVSSTVTIGIPAHSSKRISVRLRTNGVQTALTAHHATEEDQSASEASGKSHGEDEGENVLLNVQVHELKNRDETRIVALRARALWPKGGSGHGRPRNHEAGSGACPASVADSSTTSPVVEEDTTEDAETADPLPIHDPSSIIFTSQMPD